MLKLLGIDESETTDRSSLLPGYMLRLVIAVAGLGVAFTAVIVVNAFTLETDDRSDLSRIGTPVMCCAAGAMLLLMAGICKDVEMPKSCCPKCSRLRTFGVLVLLLIVVPLSHLGFSLAIAGVVLAWLVSVEGVATRLRVVAVAEGFFGLILTEILRRAGAWSDGFFGGILLASYSFSSVFLPGILIFGTVGERPQVARASCVGCTLAAVHAAAIVLSAVSTLFASLLNNHGTSLHDERCISLDLETPMMWFEALVSTANEKEIEMPDRYTDKGPISVPCIPVNMTMTTLAPVIQSAEDDCAASIGAAVFFGIVGIYALVVMITCSCVVKDKHLLVAPRAPEDEEGEGVEQGTPDTAAKEGGAEGGEGEDSEDSVDVDELPRWRRVTYRCDKGCRRCARRCARGNKKGMERIKPFLKQMLGSSVRLMLVGVFVFSALGILVLWDVVVARPTYYCNTTTQAPPASRGTAKDSPAISNRSATNYNITNPWMDQMYGSNRRVQAQDETSEVTTPPPLITTTMAGPRVAMTEAQTNAALAPAVGEAGWRYPDNDTDGGKANREECFDWCYDVKDFDMEQRCKIPGCTRCAECKLDQCADWCLDVYPTLDVRCASLACVNCPECELKPCGEDETTKAPPTPPPRVKRLPSETPLASLPEEYISVTWCGLGPWAALAIGTLAFSCHVLACSLAGEWASRYEGKSEEEALEDPNSLEAQARMPKPGFSPANMIKREAQPAPARVTNNNIRVFNI